MSDDVKPRESNLRMDRAWIRIAVATLVAFAGFGVHAATGGAFEKRTVFAMTLRVVVWLAIAALGRRALAGRVA